VRRLLASQARDTAGWRGWRGVARLERSGAAGRGL